MKTEPEYWGAPDEKNLMELLTAAHDDPTVEILHIFPKLDNKGYTIMFERSVVSDGE
jgi:hypothetical protein